MGLGGALDARVLRWGLQRGSGAGRSWTPSGPGEAWGQLMRSAGVARRESQGQNSRVKVSSLGPSG